MKKLSHAVTAIAALGLFSRILSAQAGEPLLSPRARANQIRVVPGSSVGDKDFVHNIEYGNAKARQLAYSLRTVAGAGRDIDLAHAPRPKLSPKDPRFEAALQANAVSQFQVAPLK
jgi:hypothetical protein